MGPPKGKKAYRILAFEQLETKRSPASILLAVAPLDDAAHEVLETTVTQRGADQSGSWSGPHATQLLLQFVEQQCGPASSHPWNNPSPAQCLAADQMMKLQDDALRAAVKEYSPLDGHD